MPDLKTFTKNKTLWTLFGIMIVMLLLDIGTALFGIQLPFFVKIISSYFAPVILVVHMAFVLGYARGAIFAGLAALTGFTCEYLGTHYGWFFGGFYAYANQNGPMIAEVPLAIIFYWVVFIYVGYTLTNSFLVWIGKNKPRQSAKDGHLLPLLILLDGLFVVAIDIFMDPVAVHNGSWAWQDAGPYFDVPIGNFIGWFLVTIIATTIYRVFEYIKPPKENSINKNVYIIPTGIYALICLSYIFNALSAGLPELILIGFFAMMPAVMINLILYTIWKDKNATQKLK